MAIVSWTRANRKEPKWRPVNRAARTIQDIVLEYNPETGKWQAPTICLVNNAPVLQRHWGATPVKEGQIINFVELPRGGGGGSDPAQIAVTLAFVAVAAYTGTWVSGLVGAGTALGVAAGAVTAGAIMIIGSWIMGRIFPTQALPPGHSGNIEQADPTYSPLISQNRARLYEVIGENFGRVQIVPDLAANAYARYINNEAWSYQVFGIGMGKYDIEALFFGDTPIWRKGSGLVSGYEVNLQFLEPGETVTLFPDNVEGSIEVAGQEIFPANHDSAGGQNPYIIGPFSVNPPGTVTTRIVNNLVFPEGGGRFRDNGGLAATTFSPVIEAQEIDDNGQPLGDWFTLWSGNLTYSTLTPQRISIDEEVPEGRYQVRIFRTDTPNLDGRTRYRMLWESLYSFLPGTLSYNQSVIAMEIKSGNILTQQAFNSFRVLLTRKLPLYDPQTKTWSDEQPTRKFAAALSHVLRTEWGGNLPDRLIDLDILWGDIDQTMTQKDWTFDGRITGDYTVWQLVMEMCQPFRLVPRLAGGPVTFVYDKSGRAVRHIFTPRGVIRGSLVITYETFSEDTPDDLLTSYLDEDAGFAQREVRSALPDSESRNPAVKSVISIVKRKQAFQAGIFTAECNRKRRISVKFQTEAIGRLILMGDVCALNHPFFSDLSSGEIADWNEEALSLDLGAEITPPAEGDIYLALTRPDGTPWGPCKIAAVAGQEVILDRADYEFIRAQSQPDDNPFDWADFGQGRAATVWTIQSGKEFAGRILVQSVAPVDRWRWEITAINDAPDLGEFDDLPVPPHQWRGQAVETVQPLEAPKNLTAEGQGAPENPAINLMWSPVPRARGYRVEQSVGPALWGMGQDVTTNAVRIEVSPGYVAFRVAALDIEGRPGPWTGWYGDTGSLFLPAPIILGSSFAAGAAWINWAAPPEATGSNAPAAWILTLLSPDGSTVVRTEEIRSDIFDLTYPTDLEALNIELRFRTYRGQLSGAAVLTLINPDWPAEPEEES